MDLEQKVEQMHGMLAQLITMVSELRKDVSALQVGQEELRKDVNALQVGQEELRKDVNALQSGQKELRDEVVGFRAEFRERLSIQRSQIAENAEDIEVLKKAHWQTHTR